MEQHESLGTGFNDMVDVPKNELFWKRHFPDVGRDIFDPVFVFVHECLSGAAPGFFYSASSAKTELLTTVVGPIQELIDFSHSGNIDSKFAM